MGLELARESTNGNPEHSNTESAQQPIPEFGYGFLYGDSLEELSGVVNVFAVRGFEPLGAPFMIAKQGPLDMQPKPQWVQAVFKRPKDFNAAANGKR